MGMYEQTTEFTTTCRLDALVNDLNFMIPERFIDEFNLSIRAKMYARCTSLHIPPHRGNSNTLSSVIKEVKPKMTMMKVLPQVSS